MVHAVTYKRGRYVAFDSYCACENRAWRETSALGHVDNPARLHTARDRTGHCIEDTTPPGAPPHGRLALARGRRGPMPWPMRGTPGFPRMCCAQYCGAGGAYCRLGPAPVCIPSFYLGHVKS